MKTDKIVHFVPKSAGSPNSQRLCYFTRNLFRNIWGQITQPFSECFEAKSRNLFRNVLRQNHATLFLTSEKFSSSLLYSCMITLINYGNDFMNSMQNSFFCLLVNCYHSRFNIFLTKNQSSLCVHYNMADD